MYIFLFIIGLIVGSFLNLCIIRIPEKKSIIYPSSHCDYCMKKISIIDLIPVLSYFILKGKCRYCGNTISSSNLYIELITGGLFLLIAIVKGISLLLVPYLFLISILIIVSFIDIKYYIIPNSIILTGFIIYIFLNIFLKFINWYNSLFGFMLAGTIFLIIALISKGGIGGGDIKLISLIGLYLGWEEIILVIFIASFIASIIGIYLMFIRKKSKKDIIFFGPFLSIASIITIFYGNYIIDYYINIILF